MGKAISVLGQKFRYLLVIADAGFGVEKSGQKYSLSLCRCDCGKEVIIRNHHLRSGNTNSCGCYQAKRRIESHTTHGKARKGNKSRSYIAWIGLKRRCTTRNHSKAHRYIDRGIDVCPRWLNSFENFDEDMGPCPDGMTIERMDNNKGYYPGNCIWDTKKVQANNTCRNVFLTFDGKTQTTAQWSEETKIHRATIQSRIKAGWSVERILTTHVT